MKRTLSTLPAAIAAVCVAFTAPGCTSTSASGHHGAHERLGKVHFPVECNVEAQREFDVAMAYYHSFAWQHISEPLGAY